MELTVYLDLVFLLNGVVDYLLLVGTNRLGGFRYGWGRCALAALLGGVYGAACVLPAFRFLGNGVWRIVFLLLIGSAAFGWNRSALRRFPVFVILSMALGGLASGTAMDGLGSVCLGGGLLWLLCRMGFADGGQKQEFLPAELTWNDRSIKLLALRDTGNTLRDPMTGEQVLVCGADVGEELLGIPRSWFRDPVETVAKGGIPGLRLIPYHSVGNSHGMMPALRLNRAVIGKVQSRPLVAFAPEEISKGQVYRMLTGGRI